MEKSMFKCVQHHQDDHEFREEYFDYAVEPDNILKSIAKSAFFRCVKRDKNWEQRVG